MLWQVTEKTKNQVSCCIVLFGEGMSEAALQILSELIAVKKSRIKPSVLIVSPRDIFIVVFLLVASLTKWVAIVV